jgi:hypothetical protein
MSEQDRQAAVRTRFCPDDTQLLLELLRNELHRLKEGIREDPSKFVKLGRKIAFSFARAGKDKKIQQVETMINRLERLM